MGVNNKISAAITKKVCLKVLNYPTVKTSQDELLVMDYINSSKNDIEKLCEETKLEYKGNIASEKIIKENMMDAHMYNYQKIESNNNTLNSFNKSPSKFKSNEPFNFNPKTNKIEIGQKKILENLGKEICSLIEKKSKLETEIIALNGVIKEKKRCINNLDKECHGKLKKNITYDNFVKNESWFEEINCSFVVDI
jgi:hypothetical protein